MRARAGGRIYLTGGATAVLYGWREMTININLKPDPEPPGLFEALAVRFLLWILSLSACRILF